MSQVSAPLSLDETAGAAQAVGGAADNFELLVVPAAGGVVEGELEIRERLAGAEGARAAVEAADDGGKSGAGGLQVALHAQIHAQFRAEAGGIHDAGANLLNGGAGGLDGAEVLRSGAVAALAVDAFGQIAGEDGFAIGTVVAGRHARIGGVADDALVRSQAAG